MLKKTSYSNPFYADIRKNGVVVDVLPWKDRVERDALPGRPRRGAKRQSTAVRSVRLPVELWKLLKAQAKREQISLNAALRQAARIWLRS